jgi:DNA-directed RNA polymerase III subunit RPC1
MKMAVVDVSRDDMYAHIPTAPGLPPVRRAADHGPLDLRLGTTEKSAICATCNEPLATCSGHFGYIRFTLPIFHQVGACRYDDSEIYTYIPFAVIISGPMQQS